MFRNALTVENVGEMAGGGPTDASLAELTIVPKPLVADKIKRDLPSSEVLIPCTVYEECFLPQMRSNVLA